MLRLRAFKERLSGNNNMRSSKTSISNKNGKNGKNRKNRKNGKNGKNKNCEVMEHFGRII